MKKNILLEFIEEEIENLQSSNIQNNKEEKNDEVRMASAEIRNLIKNSLSLYKLIQSEEELPGWVSAYITLSNDYINSVHTYMADQEEEPKISED